MDQESNNIARSAAEQLGPDYVAQVEAAIATGGGAEPQTFEAVSVILLGGLLLQYAQFAYTIYKDIKTAGGTPGRDDIARRVRQQIDLPPTLSPDERDRIINAVLDQIDKRNPG